MNRDDLPDALEELFVKRNSGLVFLESKHVDSEAFFLLSAKDQERIQDDLIRMIDEITHAEWMAQNEQREHP